MKRLPWSERIKVNKCCHRLAQSLQTSLFSTRNIVTAGVKACAHVMVLSSIIGRPSSFYQMESSLRGKLLQYSGSSSTLRGFTSPIKLLKISFFPKILHSDFRPKLSPPLRGGDKIGVLSRLRKSLKSPLKSKEKAWKRDKFSPEPANLWLSGRLWKMGYRIAKSAKVNLKSNLPIM